MSSILDKTLEAFNVKSLKHVGYYSIMVLSGPHEGVQVVKKPGTITIGSDGENDIILFAAQTQTKHFELELPKGLFEEIKMTPIEGAVEIKDGPRVEVGQYVNLESGTHLKIGNSEISVCRIAEPKSLIKPALKTFAIIAILAMIPFAYNLMSSLAVTAVNASTNIIHVVGKEFSLQKERYVGPTTTPRREHANAFAWNVRTKLEDFGLNYRLRASATADGSIRVSGEVSDKDVQRWNQFLQWYDRTSGYPALVRNVKRITIDKNMPQLKSVWLDDVPTVFFKDGSTAAVGEKIGNNWTVVEIDKSRVKLERDGAYVGLTF